MVLFASTLAACIFAQSVAHPECALPAKRLCAAYGKLLSYDGTANDIVWRDGTRIPFGTSRPGVAFAERIATATLWDQMSARYSRQWPAAPPAIDSDPGRMRCDAFFRKEYGSSAQDVRRNLVRVAWPPAGPGKTISFTRLNGANKALEAAGNELAALPPAVRRYTARPKGTFNWRVVEGTRRLSPHGYGIAIDFDIPGFSRSYWRWSGDAKSDGPDAVQYPVAVLNDGALRQVVEAFERHGFVWGGKWYHYDLMHFEYRPELLEDLPASHPGK